MIFGRNCADKECFVNVMETKAHDMNLFLATKSEAGHDCVPSTAMIFPVRTSFTNLEFVFSCVSFVFLCKKL